MKPLTSKFRFRWPLALFAATLLPLISLNLALVKAQTCTNPPTQGKQTAWPEGQR